MGFGSPGQTPPQAVRNFVNDLLGRSARSRRGPTKWAGDGFLKSAFQRLLRRRL